MTIAVRMKIYSSYIGYNTVWSELCECIGPTIKLTPDSVVTYLFHDCDCSAYSVARVCDDQSTVHLD